MRIRAFRATQAKRDIYVGVLSAGKLVPITSVDVRTPNNTQGYQRELANRRINEVKHYLEEADGVFPSSVLLSYRSKQFTFDPSTKDASGELGDLMLTESEPRLYVIDGQHRIEALRRAIEDDPEKFKDYPVPFTMLANPDVFEEARWFYLVNSKAKRVPVELAEELLATAADTKGDDWLRNAEAPPGSTRGDQIVMQTKLVHLVARLEQNCPVWNGHIVMAGQKPRSKEDVKAHTIITSIARGGALSDRTIQVALESNLEQLAQALSAYWEAIAMKWPVAIADGKAYSLRGTQGLYSLHAIFPDVLTLCRENRDYSVKNMSAILSSIPEDDDFWMRAKDGAEGNPLTQATSMGFLRRLARYLRDRLPEPSVPML
jgi:DGQHR domain-containing protein